MLDIVSFVILTIVSLITTWIVRKVVIMKNIFDIPNQRSSHTIATPRGGGMAIAIVWFLILIIFYFTERIESKLFWALISGFLLVVIGIMDDIKSISPKIRMAVQALTAGLALFFLDGLQFFELGFHMVHAKYILTPLAFIGILWFINLFNFLDGIDGYIGAESIFIFISAFFLTGDSILLLFSACVLGFLFWNWQKAKIFMGDVGSTLIGFNVAVFGLYYQNSMQIPFVIWLLLSAVFWFDATLTLYRRWKNNERLSEAHKKHAYQRIVQAGFSHEKTTLYALFVNILSLGWIFLSFRFEKFMILFLFMHGILIYLIIKQVDKRKAFS